MIISTENAKRKNLKSTLYLKRWLTILKIVLRLKKPRRVRYQGMGPWLKDQSFILYIRNYLRKSLNSHFKDGYPALKRCSLRIKALTLSFKSHRRTSWFKIPIFNKSLLLKDLSSLSHISTNHQDINSSKKAKF
jgi:hypothetical protein